jgi:serine/threonine protein kinase/WD40 repeat protein
MADRLETLLSAWQAARDKGRDAPVDELCRDCPELAPKLAEKIQILRQMSALGKDDETVTGEYGDPAPTEAAIPNRIGDYHILTKLGQGGMGAVYWAQDERLRRPTAVKVMRPELAIRPGARERFIREARAAAAVEHESIVPIWHVGEDNGVPYIAMPLLRGESLSDRLHRAGALPTADVIRYGRDVAAGLAAAHRAGLIHRDIKPANIWLELKEEGIKARILDFGLARLDDDADPRLTGTGDILGTPAYMAPEQARNSNVDHRADLFSLGCVLYHAATGQAPFRGASVMDTLLAVAQHQPPDPRSLAPVPEALAVLINRLMTKDPAHRLQSATEVTAALKAIEERNAKPAPDPPLCVPLPAALKPTESSPPPAKLKAPLPPPRRTHRAVWVALLGLLILATIGTAAFFAKRVHRPDVTTIRASDLGQPENAGFEALDPTKIPRDEHYTWQAPELVAVVGGHGGLIGPQIDSTQAVLSGNAKWLAWADEAGFRLLETDTLRIRFHDAHATLIRPAFSDDGRLVGFGSDRPSTGSRGARLVELNGPEPKALRGIAYSTGPHVTALAFSRDGKTVATGNEAGAIELWTTSAAAKAAPKLVVQKGGSDRAHPVGQLMFTTEDDRLIALLHDDFAHEATVRGWSINEPTAKELFSVTAPPATLRAAISPGGERLILPSPGQADPELAVWILTGKLRKTLTAPAPPCRVAEFLAPSSKALPTQVWLGYGGSTALWNLDYGVKKDKAVTKWRDLPNEGLAISADANRQVSRGSEGRLTVQNAQNRDVVVGPAPLADAAHPPVLLAGRLYTFRPTPQTWVVKDGQLGPAATPVAFDPLPSEVVGTPAAAPGGRCFACRTRATVEVYALANNRFQRTAVLSPASPATTLTWGKDDQTLRTSHKDGVVLEWDLKTAAPASKPIGKLAEWHPTHEAVILPGEAFALVTSADRTVWRRSLTNPLATPTSLCKEAGPRLWLSGDGAWLATDEIGGIAIWDARSGGRKTTIALPARPAAVQWAEDGRHLAITMLGLVYVVRV